MEIDALTKKGKGHKGKEQSKTDGQKTSCFVCRRVGHMARDCWCKETSKGSAAPSNKGKRDKGKGKDKNKNSVNEVATPTESTTTPPVETSASQISRITQDDTCDRPVPRMRKNMRVTKLDTSWQRSDTENHSASTKVGLLCTYWWTVAQMSMCALHEILSGSPVNQAGIPIWYRQVDTN